MMDLYPYALQLYSVRDYFPKGVEMALQKVKNAGYRYVELAGCHGKSSTEFKALLDAAGLAAVSMHVGIDELMNQPEHAARQARNLQVPYIVVPWLGGELCPDRDSWLQAARAMDKLGAFFRSQDLTLCYHNHSHEFARFGDETIFDLIFRNTDPANLLVELDLCWASVGGANINALLEEYSQRIPLVHVKDYHPQAGDRPVRLVELGTGIMDWDILLPAAKKAGTLWFIVEQDESEGDSMESAFQNGEFMFARNR